MPGHERNVRRDFGPFGLYQRLDQAADHPTYLRCESCGQMTRNAAAGQICRRGAPLPDPLPYW
jgi:hypothetical protein